jgi:hypothetical protein
MLKLPWMEDPVKGIISLEFIGPYRINTDIRVISTESSPDSSSTLAEGDRRTPIFSQEEMGSAKRAGYHLNGESRPVRKLTAFPKRAFHRCKVTP